MDCFDSFLLSWFNLDDVFSPDPGSNEKKAHLARLDKSVLRQISMFWIWLNHVKLMVHQAETFGSVDQDIANCFKPVSNLISQCLHHFSISGRQVSITLKGPESEPVSKVFSLEVEWHVFGDQSTSIQRGATCETGPKARDLLDVHWPILNLSLKNRADDRMLANISIKMGQQVFQPFLAADAIIKRFFDSGVFHFNRLPVQVN